MSFLINNFVNCATKIFICFSLVLQYLVKFIKLINNVDIWPETVVIHVITKKRRDGKEKPRRKPGQE